MEKVHTPEIDNIIATFEENPEAYDLKVKTLVQELKLVKANLTLAAYQVKEAKRKQESQAKEITILHNRTGIYKKLLWPSKN